tara:strand:+ start:373 stop:819 length:447 start_codon:yes stop_codon:yes gene_type:complete
MTEITIYLYIKAFHIISVIAWCAAMLYLPRLYVYHVDLKPNSEASSVFKLMEKRLSRYIMTPAMLASWFFGLILIFYFNAINFSSDIWFHMKFLLVILMSAYHGFLLGKLKKFQNDQNTNTQNYYRVLNEVPTILIILIVILVVVKPF